MTTFQELARENAKRLLDDAELLHAHGRHASATAMAIFALEECGKYLTEKWREDGFHISSVKRKGYHEKKQLAASSIVPAVVAVTAIFDLLEKYEPQFGNQPITKEVLREELKKAHEWMATQSDVIARALAADESSQTFEYSQRGVIEKVKQVALYVDRDLLKKGLQHTMFGENDARSMIDSVKACMKRIDNVAINKLARALLQAQMAGA